MKQLLFIGLSAVLFVSGIQLGSVTTFAASVATSGPYANVDVTTQNNEVPATVENAPDNKVARPERATSEYTNKEPYDELIANGWEEVITLRNANSKTFEDPTTGEQETFVYMGAIHYQVETGEWLEYNSNLELKNDGLLRSFFSATKIYTEKAGDVGVEIPTNITDATPIGMNFEDVRIDILPDTNLSNPQVSGNVATYEANDAQDTQVVHLGGGLLINEKFYSDIPDELSYTYTVNEGYSLYTNETKTIVAIVQDDNAQLMGVVEAPKIVDGNKEPYTAQTTIEALPTENKQTYTLKVGLKNLKSNPTPPSYPIDVATSNVTIPHGTVQIYAINNWDADVTYGPGGGGKYEDMFLIGDNHASPIYFPMGIYKAFVTTGIGSWQSFIGEKREITSATLNIFEFTHSQAQYPNSSEIKVMRIENDYQGRPSSVTWNKWIASSANVSAVTSTWASKYDNDFVKFNITDAVSDWYTGAPDYGLLLDTTRDDEGLIFLNHSWSNTNLLSWGGIDGRPFIQVSHKKAEPVPNDLELSKTTVNLRPFTSNEQGGLTQFQALGFDGITRPGSVVDIEVYEVDHPENKVYSSKAISVTGFRSYPYYEPPIYPAIEKVQKYYGLSSNWQDPTLLYTKDLKKDVLYQVKIKSKLLHADGTIKEESEWITGDTFQVYQVKGFDHLPRIMNFYGLNDKILLMKDNHMRDELLVESNEIFIRNPKKNKGKPYIAMALSENDKKNIDGYLMGQGKHCEFGYEPINFNTGNFYYTNKDTSFVDFGEEIAIERHYNSMAGGTESLFGRNWELNWNKQITFLENGDVFYLDGTGKRILFTKIGDNQYAAQGGEVLTLTKIQTGTKQYTEETGYYDSVEDTPKTTTIDIPNYQYTITDKNDQVMTFNSNGLLEKVKVDRYEHYMTFSYNEEGNINKITTPTGKTMQFEYNLDGYIKQITLPDSNTLQYEYDAKGNLTAFVDQEGHKLVYRYEDTKNDFLMTSYIARGDKSIIIQNTYDEKGRVTKQVDAKGDTAHFTYFDNRTEITGFNGEQQTVFIDELKRTTEKINADGASLIQAYDADNNLIQDKQANQSPITYTYDGNGNVLTETRSDGKVKTYSYNTQHLPISITDFDGTTIMYAYDSYGNQTRIQYPDGSTIINEYNNDGQITQSIDRNGNMQQYTYTNGNKISESDSYGSKQYAYDAMGRILSETDAVGNTNSFSRSKRGELLSIARPNGTQAFQYNADGEKIWEKDANGNEKRYSYDVWSRLIEEVDSYGTKSYTYDSYGNMLSSTDERGNRTTYEYDTGNRKVKTIFADGSEELYIYDERGRLIETIDQHGFSTTNEYEDIHNLIVKMTNAYGVSTEYNYDVFGNLTKVIYPDGTFDQSIYDCDGNVIESINRLGVSTIYTYDYNGNVLESITGARIEKKQYGNNDVTLRTIDALGQVEQQSYTAVKLVDTVTMKNGSTLRYKYDGEYNIIEVIDSAGNSTKKEYDGNKNVTKAINQAGFETTYTYTARNQLATTTYADGGIVQNVYDAVGNQIEVIDQLGNSIQNEYDSMNRPVVKIDALGYKTTYVYDKRGQLIESTDPFNQRTEYTYDALGNQVVQINPTGIILYKTYDLMGNVIEENDNFQRFTKYTYNVLGNMIESTNWKGETTSNVYDAYGNKISETDIRGNTTTYEYDVNNQLVKTVDAKGNIKMEQLNPIGQSITRSDNQQVTTNSYSSTGNMLSSTDKDGNSTTFKYDKMGNITETTLPNGSRQTTTYTPTGLIATTTDANGGIVQNTYDLKGQLIQVVDPEGNKTQYQYDASGNQILAIDPLGFAVKTEYDALNRPIKTTDKNGNSTKTEYNVWNQVSRLDAPNNVSQRFEYNDKGQLIKTWDGNGNVTTNTYNDFDQLVESKQPNGFIETTIYNEYSDVIAIQNNAGGMRSTNTSSTNNSDSFNNDDSLVTSELNTYDQFGQLISKIDANNNETQYEYNSKGQIIKTRAANGNEISYVYDDNGRVASMTDIRGNETAYLYDALGQVLAVKNLPKDTRPQSGLEPTDASNEKEWNYTYDGNGNLLSETDPLAAITSYTYNKNNQMTQTTNALGQSQTTTYDARGAITNKTDAKGNTTAYAYDANGNKTIETDAQGNQTAFDYDENNRMTTVRDRRGAETAYAYDQNSNLIKTTNANGAETKFEYDNMNNQTKVTTADHKVQTYTYDLKGNQTSQKNQDGRIITYKYDALNNQVFKGFDDKQYQYTYNTENQVTSVVDKESKATLEYNQYGDLISYTDQNKNMVQYDYDSIGRRIGLTYPDGTQTKYEYDLNDHLVKVETNNDLTTYSYDVLGNLLSTTLPNGSVTSYRYDANNQIEQLKTISKNGTVLSNIEYAYDERGNISSENSTIASKDTSSEATSWIQTLKTYTYNEEEQLLSSTHVSGGTTKEYSYLYDQVGNKLAVTETIAGIVTNKQYKFDNKNALTEEKGGLGVDYQYDATGNVSQKRYANGIVENFKYDAEGMLLSIQSTTGKTINYSYDGFGNRTQKTEKTEVPESENAGFLSFLKADDTYNEEYDQELVSQTTNEQLGNLRQTISEHLETYEQTCPVTDEDEPKSSLETINYVNDINREFTEVLQIQNAKNETIHTYTYGVQRINDTKKDEQSTAYMYDGRGSVIGKQTQTKPEQLSFKVTYDDFGKPNVKMDNQYGYNGESHDYNSSQYLRARYYDNKSGTFGQQDTYLGDTESPASQNRYAYTMNNPINASDPSGNRPLLDAGGNDRALDEAVFKQDINNKNHREGRISDEDYYNKEADIWGRYNSSTTSGINVQSYVDQQREAAKEASRKEKAKYDNLVSEWTGDAGDVGSQVYFDLLAQGIAPARAYELAHGVKKYCEENLEDWQVADVKRILSGYTPGDQRASNFFFDVKEHVWYQGKDKYALHQTGEKKTSYYTAFSAYLLNHPTAEQNVTLLINFASYMAGWALVGYALYGFTMGTTPTATTNPNIAGNVIDPDGDGVPGTGTVWNSIKPTQETYSNSTIPKSFTLNISDENFWIHPNATKHMVEYTQRNGVTFTTVVTEQQMLTSFKTAVDSLVSKGIEYGVKYQSGNWELMFSAPKDGGLYPVIYHALYIP